MIHKNKIFFFLLSFAFYSCLSQQVCYGQFLEKDSLVVSVKTPLVKVNGIFPDSVVDSRNLGKKVLGIGETKKYLVVPIDHIVMTPKPIATHISDIFSKEQTPNASKLNLKIEEFELGYRSGKVAPGHVLNASIKVFKDTAYMGNLVYQSYFKPKPFKKKLKIGVEGVMSVWQSEFREDMEKISKGWSSNKSVELPNFRKNVGNSINMFTGVDFTYTLDGWMLEADIMFSNREAGRWSFRNGYGVKYRKQDDFQSIEFALVNDHAYYRLSDSWVLKGKLQFWLGFNKWDDFDTVDHELWDALIGDFTMSQGIYHNKLDKTGIVAGVSLVENLYYVHSKELKFQPGLMVHFGYKF